jgi:hypothetical protein
MLTAINECLPVQPGKGENHAPEVEMIYGAFLLMSVSSIMHLYILSN